MTGTAFTGAYFDGIVLNNAATQNPATITAGGYVGNTGTSPSYNGDAVYGKMGTVWTVVNDGTIVSGAVNSLSVGIDLKTGGQIIGDDDASKLWLRLRHSQHDDEALVLPGFAGISRFPIQRVVFAFDLEPLFCSRFGGEWRSADRNDGLHFAFALVCNCKRICKIVGAQAAVKRALARLAVHRK